MKKYLFVLLLLFSVLFVLRVSEVFKESKAEGPIQVSGEVNSPPYLSRGKLHFRVDRFWVESEYLKLGVGEKVLVKGEVSQGKIKAQQVTKLPTSPLQSLMSGLRNSFEEQIKFYFPDPKASLLAGVTLGADNLPRKFKEDLIATGTIHVVVVSGYNIALVGGFVMVAAPFLGRRKTILLAIIAILCYTLLVGSSPPTVRAALLGTITLFGLLLGKKTMAVYALFLAGLFMLLLKPSYLLDVSFQLSFLATLGVVSFTDGLAQKFRMLPPLFRDSLATTLAAQTLVVPVLLFYFGSVSLLSPLVNSLVLWLIPVLTVGGFVFLIGSFLSNLLSELIGLILILPLSLFTGVVEFFAQFDIFILRMGQGNLAVLLGYYLILAGFLLSKTKNPNLTKQGVLERRAGGNV